MSGAIHLLPLYAFMAYTETTSPHRFDFTSQEEPEKTPEGCHKSQPAPIRHAAFLFAVLSTFTSPNRKSPL